MTSDTRRAHDLLTSPGPLSEGPLGRLYSGQLRRVRELRERLQEVDPEWLREWEKRERGR